MKIKTIYISLLGCLLTTLPMTAQTTVPPENSQSTACPMVEINAEQLANLTTPRSGHCAFRIGQEIVLVGGHTLGFIPTKTAEYYDDDEWHQLETVYDHDGGFGLQMKSGKVLLAGGFETHLGIGQTYVAEMYDPQTRTFEGFGCLDKKRALASAIELDSNKVYITGNRYGEDEIECFDGECTFSFVKEVTNERYMPFIFKIAPDDAIIFSGRNCHGKELDSIIVDRLKGESFSIPLLDIWRPLLFEQTYRSEEFFIGDEAKGIYAYLLPVKDKNGRIAIIKVQGLDFSLLPTSCPIPTETNWGTIEYITPILIDQQTQRGYMVGRDKDRRCFVLCIEYAKAKDNTSAPLTLYYTPPIPEAGNGRVILTAGGDLMLTGGISGSNFTPFSTVFLFRFVTKEAASKGLGWLWAVLLLVVLLALALLAFLYFRRRLPKPQPLPIEEPAQAPVRENAKGLRLPTDTDEVLIQRICKLLEQERLYLNCELKVADIADRLGTNKRYISDCINTQKGITFIQLVNKYRIEYAKRLLKDNPEIKITEVYIKSGFANETSFFRVFKAHTGLTPSQYKI